MVETVHRLARGTLDRRGTAQAPAVVSRNAGALDATSVAETNAKAADHPVTSAKGNQLLGAEDLGEVALAVLDLTADRRPAAANVIGGPAIENGADAMNDLLSIVRALPAAKEPRKIDDNGVLFIFVDKDKDKVPVTLVRIGQERLVACSRVGWPSDAMLAGMFAANAWSGREEAHDAFSYSDEEGLYLESHLPLFGALRDADVVKWLRDYLSHIDPWETVAVTVLNELGDDSNFEMAASREGWAIVGKIAGGFVGQILQS